jgi:VWFA-related protein
VPRIVSCWVVVAALCLGPCAVAQSAPEATDAAPEGAEPRRSDLVERTGARLVQLDVTVAGPPEEIVALTPDDFKVKLGFKKIREFTLDRFCELPEQAPLWGPAPRDEPPVPRSASGRPATFLLYFDQPHLTAPGRHRSMQLARELIPRLIRDGNRGMLVSNARSLATLTGFTTDSGELLAAVAELEDDREQWDFFAVEERDRVNEVVTTLNRDGNIELAIAKARGHQREERWRTERNLRRLQATLSRLSALEAPKAVLYFADTMRSNAGQHYLSFFGTRLSQSDHTVLSKMGTDSTTASIAFDRVVNEAAAQGIRFYSVRPEGLTGHLDINRPGQAAVAITGQAGFSSRTRVGHARQTLRSLSSETGGEAFLHGTPAPEILERIVADMSCLYLVSFRPTGYLLDEPHRVVVDVRRPGITARSRGRVVLQSEETRLTSRLLGAFTAPDASEQEFEVRGSLVPIGFDDGRYSALVQVSVPGMPIGGTTWDLGASVVSRQKVHAETSGRLSVGPAGVPAILESEIRFPPGQQEIVTVAHEQKTDLVVSGRVRSDWPRPEAGPAAVGPIAVLQPHVAAFSRDGVMRGTGSVAFPEDTPVNTTRPTALVGLVCRGKAREDVVVVERTLVGDSSIDFPPIELDLAEHPCAQVRDVIPAETLGPGVYRYELRVLRAGEVLSENGRLFSAGEPPS